MPSPSCARYIVGGGVRRFQDSVRITVQLVDVVTNLQLWGNTYKGKLDDIFDIQELVVQQIVEALKLKLTFSERLSLTKRQTLNAEAYRAMGLSYFLWGKLNEATASCTKAIEIDPDDFIAHWTLGRIYFTEGKLEQALDLFRRVAEIKPSFYAGHLDVAQTCTGLGRDEEAATVYRRLLEIMPNYLLQNPDDARARLIYASKLGWAGRKEEAIREGTKALVLSPGDPVMLYNAACMYVGLGESVRAIDALRQAVEAGYTNFGWMQNDPDLVSLRDDPAFIEMLRDLSSRPTSPSAS